MKFNLKEREEVLRLLLCNPGISKHATSNVPAKWYEVMSAYPKLKQWLKKDMLMTSKRFKDYSLKNCDIPKNAKHVCHDYINNLDSVIEKGHGLYFWSNAPGSGKTTTMRVILEQMFVKKALSVYFNTMTNIKNIIKSEFGKDNILIPFEQKLQQVDVLAIDDLGSEYNPSRKNDGWLDEVIKNIIDDRYNNQKILMITSNYRLDVLSFHEKIRDRLRTLCHEVQFSEKSFRKFGT